MLYRSQKVKKIVQTAAVRISDIYETVKDLEISPYTRDVLCVQAGRIYLHARNLAARTSRANKIRMLQQLDRAWSKLEGLERIVEKSSDHSAVKEDSRKRTRWDDIVFGSKKRRRPYGTIRSASRSSPKENP